ncbi:MAG: hypothetical protein QG622_3535 [Actinomycetota bacterium]|nr:hypothetical protein [Actinomycetota bacterium]
MKRKLAHAVAVGALTLAGTGALAVSEALPAQAETCGYYVSDGVGYWHNCNSRTYCVTVVYTSGQYRQYGVGGGGTVSLGQDSRISWTAGGPSCPSPY